MPKWKPSSTEADALWRELRKVAERPATNFLTLRTVGVDALEAPILYRIVRHLRGERLASDPNDALMLTLRDAIEHLPEGKPDGIEQTWRELATLIFGLDPATFHATDGRRASYSQLREQVQSREESHTIQRRISSMRGHLANALLALRPDEDPVPPDDVSAPTVIRLKTDEATPRGADVVGPELANRHQPPARPEQEVSLEVTRRASRSDGEPKLRDRIKAAALSVLAVTVVLASVWADRAIRDARQIPDTFVFDGTLKVKDLTNPQEGLGYPLEFAMGDQIELDLNLTNNTGHDLASPTLKISYREPPGDGEFGSFEATMVAPDAGIEYDVTRGDESVMAPSYDRCLRWPVAGNGLSSVPAANGSKEVTTYFPLYTMSPDAPIRQNRDYGAPVDKYTLATYNIGRFAKGGHLDIQLPVTFGPDPRASVAPKTNAVTFKTEGDPTYQKVGTVARGERIRLKTVLDYGACSAAVTQTQVNVAVRSHSGGYADVFASASNEVQVPRKPVVIGQVGMSYPGIPGGALSYISGSTKLWAYGTKTCKPTMVRHLPDGILGAGVDVGNLVPYVADDYCGGRLHIRFVTMEFVVR